MGEKRVPPSGGLLGPSAGLLGRGLRHGADAVAGLGGPRDAPATVRVLARSGAVAPVRPDRLARAALAFARYGVSPAAGVLAAGALHPRTTAVIETDTGTVRTWGQLTRGAEAAAAGLTALGVGEGDVVALLARNSAAYVESVAAVGLVGADAVHVNTGFAGPQLAGVLDAQQVSVVLHDAEFGDVVAAAAGGRSTVVLDGEPPAGRARARVTSRAASRAAAAALPPPPGRPGRQVILTSGTTGVPKGAARSGATSRDAAGFLERVPLRAGRPVAVAAPMFHAWGFAGLSMGLALGGPLVVSRRFEPEAFLAAVAAHRVDTVVAVPVMLQRLLELPPEARTAHDTRSLRVIAVSGSALPGDLATRVLAAFGDVLYNLYGSTEVAYATIATPADLRADPATAGRPVRGARVEVLDEAGRPLPPGVPGRVFVGSDLVFSGYTDGRDKERVRGLVSTGDVGRFDAVGRLRVEGRDDDMVVSGGENVFPVEVEDVLHAHPAVAEAVVVGVPDEAFGQALVAHVVLRPGTRATPEELRALVRERLARFKVPREVVLVDRLPRNETGKVLRRELR